jgi:hypothetical protein
MKMMKTRSNIMTKEKQLQFNVEKVLDMYYNGMMNDDEWCHEMTIEECRQYVTDQIYDMKYSGNGHTKYAKGICDDLKFLGNDYIYNVIDTYAIDSGIIKED